MSEQEKNNLNLVVTEERIEGVELETYYNLENESVKAAVDFVAHFCADENDKWMPRDEAIAFVLKGRTLVELNEIAEELRDKMEEIAVPKE